MTGPIPTMRTASCSCGRLRIEVRGEPRGRRHPWVTLPPGTRVFEKDPG